MTMGVTMVAFSILSVAAHFCRTSRMTCTGDSASCDVVGNSSYGMALFSKCLGTVRTAI